MSRYFALGNDGIMYDLCECEDFEAAEKSSKIVLPEGVIGLWLADEVTALSWANKITGGCIESARLRLLSDREGKL